MGGRRETHEGSSSVQGPLKVLWQATASVACNPPGHCLTREWRWEDTDGSRQRPFSNRSSWSSGKRCLAAALKAAALGKSVNQKREHKGPGAYKHTPLAPRLRLHFKPKGAQKWCGLILPVHNMRTLPSWDCHWNTSSGVQRPSISASPTGGSSDVKSDVHNLYQVSSKSRLHQLSQWLSELLVTPMACSRMPRNMGARWSAGPHSTALLQFLILSEPTVTPEIPHSP